MDARTRGIQGQTFIGHSEQSGDDLGLECDEATGVGDFVKETN